MNYWHNKNDCRLDRKLCVLNMRIYIKEFTFIIVAYIKTKTEKFDMATKIVNIISFVIAILAIHQQFTNTSPPPQINQYRFRAEWFKCGASDLCEEKYCFIKHVNKSLDLLNFGCNLKKTVNSLIFHFNFYYQYNSEYKRFPINIVENFCDNRQQLSKLKIINTLTHFALPYASCNLTCPLSGNVTLTNLPFDKRMFPQILPSGQFKVFIRVYTKENETLMLGEMNIAVSGLKAIDFK